MKILLFVLLGFLWGRVLRHLERRWNLDPWEYAILLIAGTVVVCLTASVGLFLLFGIRPGDW